MFLKNRKIISKMKRSKVTDYAALIVKSYGQHIYLEEAMKSSQPEFYANASLSSQILCPKHYISMYLGEYPAKL